MNWTFLEDAEQLNQIKKESTEKIVLIFKHSTRCNISRATLDRLERNWKDEEMKNVKPYFLDLISYRNISNQIANQFGVEHESPQILIVQNGKSIYDNSHFGIEYDAIKHQTSVSKN